MLPALRKHPRPSEFLRACYTPQRLFCRCFPFPLKKKGDRSSRQGRNPAGASPAVPVARFRHVAMPVLWAGNDPEFGLVYMARPPKTHRGLAVCATWGPSELWSLNMSE